MKKEKHKITPQEKNVPDSQIKNNNVKTNLFYIILIFLTYILGVILYICVMPGMNEDSKKKLRVLAPKNFKDLKNILSVGKIKILYEALISYRNEHGIALLILLSLFYISYNSFPLFLWWMTGAGSGITILIGAFYNYTFSIIYCTMLSILASLIAYVVYGMYGKSVIEYLLKDPLAKFNEQLNKRVKTTFDLFSYIAILRLTPIFPNTLINILAPCLSLPVIPLVFATLVGNLPNIIILVSIGQTINRLSSIDMTHQFYVPIAFIVLLIVFQRIMKYTYVEPKKDKQS
ncbi:SNARE associated Golgi protein, putative [Plasmodium chabaudi chabaudi]|uniref:SNARE associated Golgi protein, putative n=2 Tax=Plasmodium chabaudi TaxID=5825 RepID=A0A077TL04_PLACU|nr:SNARE associated Golgi protein, putative [Plasmodium chabaudi chabaudi]SCM19150.1 SNARE associated Golgi protein, putative [Plasmodium chabaudi adami]SCM19228.1 SNARE associated Golgi protein, putative [Plasmodium chabaudi chabaudi]SCN58746.1 SNARE associated Golgi protein, putative [Plasmodium chabaudi adami]VTZ66280.1 SNARE associated Golgi protein, putative [Plasmodium chabaudi chabaudi]|eukprot:XP_016653011.1 SNARE associated Golgi protein, putative [Plasmodium chabaudi chabaudi]